MALDIQLSSNYPVFKDHGVPACATTDPEIFFPEKGAKGASTYVVNAARRMCAGCPYKQPCLEWAVVHDEMGIWGGTTAKERRVHRRALKSRKEGKAIE
jgi:WhiB family redox-sensing transcriptional regulator